MEITLFLKFEGDAVFSANGVFLENDSCIKFRQCESVFVTVFPLSLALLPYTVKFSGANVRPCEVVTVVTLCENRFLALFKKRFAYAFSHNSRLPCGENSPCKFFDCVKKQDFPSARRYLTSELNESLSDEALSEFFSPYVSMIDDNRFLSDEKNAYLLIDEQNRAHSVTLSLNNNLIDDITEK